MEPRAILGNKGPSGLLAVIDQIYASVEQPEKWPKTIGAIGDFIGGRRDFWIAEEPLLGPPLIVNPRAVEAMAAGCSSTFVLSRADLRLLDEYTQKFGDLIARFLKILFLSMLWSQKDVSAREILGLKMIQRYLQNFDPSEPANSTPSKSAMRNLIAALWQDGRMFNEDRIQSISLFGAHLDRALRFQMRLSATQLQANTVSGVLDQLIVGVVLVDRTGLRVWHNRRAEEIMMNSDVLRVSPAGFVGRTPADTRALREFVNGAISNGVQGVLALPRSESLRPLLLTAVSLEAHGLVDMPDQFACAAIFISDPERTENPTIDSLRRAFNLTHREAEMTIAIASGHGLKAAANRMGVALTTARSQLQQAFSKTGTKHQAELAALVRTLTHLRHDRI